MALGIRALGQVEDRKTGQASLLEVEAMGTCACSYTLGVLLGGTLVLFQVQELLGIKHMKRQWVS